MVQPARVLAAADVRLVLKHVRSSRRPLRARAAVLLSFKAGLRACEIGGLDWSMSLMPDGSVDREILVARSIAKNGAERRIPLHPDLRAALITLHQSQGRPRRGPVLPSERGGHLRARSVVNWFAQIYGELGLDGCSSHSGRRTFITNSARVIARTGGSLRDIQELAGHRSLTTTERYIAGSRDAQRKLVRLI